MDVAAKKSRLRKELLDKRTSIPSDQFEEKSAQICNRLKDFPVFQNAQTIHCYVSMNQRGEVNTHPLIKDMLGAGINVVVPVTKFESGNLQHVHLEKFNQLKENKWGVLEPEGGEEVPVHQLELVIVPMVGGDRQRNRLGYGKGFYDRFLSKVNCLTIGLLFERCLIDEIPVEPFDVPLDMLITEEEIIQ
ncbi:MAG: 5-formyltetrahydrofolate cyclo-ligase [Balneolaceae bacterium]|nr:5-formyltetrahydrofolate cyclo-ligase [Balneolaceae bacterium]